MRYQGPHPVLTDCLSSVRWLWLPYAFVFWLLDAAGHPCPDAARHLPRSLGCIPHVSARIEPPDHLLTVGISANPFICGQGLDQRGLRRPPCTAAQAAMECSRISSCIAWRSAPRRASSMSRRSGGGEGAVGGEQALGGGTVDAQALDDPGYSAHELHQR